MQPTSTATLDPRPVRTPLPAQERAILGALASQHPSVAGRRLLARLAGIADLSERRCDGILAALRRRLGPASIVTVRSRGWVLSAQGHADAVELLAGPS